MISTAKIQAKEVTAYGKTILLGLLPVCRFEAFLSFCSSLPKKWNIETSKDADEGQGKSCNVSL